MPGSWEFLMADADERARFADRDAVQRWPGEPAAPPNRNRRVLRLRHGDRVWYWKQFGPTSWTNRWRFCRSRPRARDDGEREALVTLALHRAGIAAPRPVLRGRDGAGSYYLCAELPGRPLRLCLRDGPLAPDLLRRAAAFCGDVLQQGFRLPDLSAEHVFVQQEAGLRFGLLDLHNGALAPPGPPPRWLCRRVLRHFARSVQELPVARATALRFAARLLRSAGRRGDARALLAGLPPLDTAARYEAAGKATAYRDRNPARTARELDLLARVWPGRTGETVLDAPCGTGRLSEFLRARGHRVVQADGALAMLRTAPRSQGIGGVQAHALALPLRDRAVDGVVVFRFLHHLERQAARAAVAEACRVARRFVVVSFFHPCSSHHLSRRLRDLVTGRAARRHAFTLARLRRWCAACGFEPHARAAELPFVRDLWVAAFVRRADAGA